MMKRFLLLLVCLLPLGGSLRAQALSERSRADLEKFLAAAQAEAVPAAKTPAAPTLDEERSAVSATWMMLNQLREQSASTDPRQIVEALTQLSLSLSSDPLRQQARKLAAQISAEQTAAEAAQTQEIETALRDAAAVVRKAATPAELDPSLGKLSEINTRRQELQRFSPKSAVLTQQIKTALDFVTGWQEYLSLVQAGSPGAGQSLSSLSEHPWQEAIPRSRILELMHGQRWTPATSATSARSEADDILQRIKTPEDLAAAMDALTTFGQAYARQHGLSEDTALTTVVKNLGDLEQAYREFKAGLSTKLTLVIPEPYHYLPYQAMTAAVRAQVLSLMLPRYLGLPEGVKAQPGEGPYPFLERIAGEAVGRGDYLLAAKARDAQRLLRDGSSYGSLEDSQAGQYIIGRNQETAGQFALAVGNYERALASASELMPAKAIGERLAAIKSEHPDEFKQGMDNYLSPPLPANYPGDRFRPPFYGRGFPRDPRSGPSPTPTPPSLTIPAAPAPEAAPKNP